MLKSLLVLSFLIVFKFDVFGQGLINAVRQYDNDTPITTLDSSLSAIPKTIFLSLFEGFDDSTSIFINDTCIYNDYLKSNESIGHTGLILPVQFQDSSQILILTIRFKKSQKLLKEQLTLTYKSVQVRGLRQWMFIYTNRFPMLK